MRKIIAIAFLATVFIACKQQANDGESNSEANSTQEAVNELPEGQVELKGEYLAYNDIIVLNASNEIYEVERNELAIKLSERTAAIKKNEHDAPMVKIQGTLKPNPKLARGEEAWAQVLTIKKIIEISPAKQSNVITTGSTIELNDIK